MRLIIPSILTFAAFTILQGQAAAHGARVDTQVVGDEEAGQAALAALNQSRLEMQAEELDPAYASLKAERRSLMLQIMDAERSYKMETDDDGFYIGEVPQELRELIQRANDLTERMEKTKGYKYFVSTSAREAIDQMRGNRREGQKTFATMATEKHYLMLVYRDSSVPSTIANSTLVGYVNSAMGRIDSAVRSASGNARYVTCQTWGPFSINMGNECIPSPSDGYGTTFKVYFRYGKTPQSGYQASKYAVIDLRPDLSPSTCSSGRGPDWDDQVSTTHEVGHIFGGDHAGCGTTERYNDYECTNANCGYEYSCDWYSRCSMERYDAEVYKTNGYCGKDAKNIDNFVIAH